MFAKTTITVAAIIALSSSLVFADEINPVLGKVGDFSIRETDLDRLIATQPVQAQKQIQEKPELKTSLVRDILLKKAIAMKARKEGYDKKPEYREKLSYLADDFLAQEFLARVVLAELKVSEEDMNKYYKEHEKDFQLTESVKARHIFIQLHAKATEDEKVAARKKAEEALSRLKKGDDFAKVALELSDDPDTAKKGGALGVLTPGKTNSEEFEKAAFALKTSEISEIVQSPFGFHIIKADEKTDKRIATFEEAKSYIEATLKKELEQKKGEEFVEKIYKESGLEVFADKAATKADEQVKSPNR
ncbi:MAG: peptidylprolyl isomerase [Geobacteraceae bacterium]|nr:peptidylprolyl isomerase [Geobacteraceae bacterium]